MIFTRAVQSDLYAFQSQPRQFSGDPAGEQRAVGDESGGISDPFTFRHLFELPRHIPDKVKAEQRLAAIEAHRQVPAPFDAVLYGELYQRFRGTGGHVMFPLPVSLEAVAAR